MPSNKKQVSSRQRKIEPDKKRVSIKDELKPNGSVSCKCGEKMEFYGVDGTGGLKFSCPKCYEKRNIKSDNR